MTAPTYNYRSSHDRKLDLHTTFSPGTWNNMYEFRVMIKNWLAAQPEAFPFGQSAGVDELAEVLQLFMLEPRTLQVLLEVRHAYQSELAGDRTEVLQTGSAEVEEINGGEVVTRSIFDLFNQYQLPNGTIFRTFVMNLPTILIFLYEKYKPQGFTQSTVDEMYQVGDSTTSQQPVGSNPNFVGKAIAWLCDVVTTTEDSFNVFAASMKYGHESVIKNLGEKFRITLVNGNVKLEEVGGLSIGSLTSDQNSLLVSGSWATLITHSITAHVDITNVEVI